MNLSVVIPSRKPENLLACVEAIRRNDPKISLTIVDDGLNLKLHQWSAILPANMVEGKKPFIYARNVNIGITAARREDNPDAVILLNDDALLLTPLGFTHLAEAAAKHPEYGIVSAVTNFAGNAAQIAKNVGFREEPNMLCFIAVLITAACLDRVGPLDERFTAYGWEDNDFCRRARQAGFKLGIYDLCFVDHRTLVSTFREDVHCGISAGAAIYREKWGDLA